MSVPTSVTTKLLKRGNIYYLRFRTPKHIQALGFRNQVVKSLKTTDHVQAQAMVLSKMRIMERIYMTTDVAILQQLFEELSDFSCTDQLKRHEREPAAAFLSDLEGHIRACMEYGCTKLDTEVSSQLAPLTSHRSPLKTQIPQGGGDVYDLLLTLIEAHKANVVNGRSDQFHALKEKASKIAKISPQADTHLASSISLFKVFDEFLAESERKKLSNRILKEYVRTLETLKEIAEDMPLNKVKRTHVRGWLTKWLELPKRNLKEYKGKTATECLEMDIPEEHLVSVATVDGVRKTVQGIFSLAVANGHIESSPASSLKLKLSSNATYARFTDEEVLALQAASKSDPKIKAEPWRKWMPLLAQFTGARRAELVYLDSRDILKDDNSDRYYINLTEKVGTKTAAAVRRIPVHTELVKAGFIDFVESMPDGRLFPNLKPSKLSYVFGLWKDKAGIEETDSQGNRKVLHSYRHTVITKIRAAGVTDKLMQPVLGHAVQKNISDRYTHMGDEPIATFFPVIDSINYT